MRTKQQQIDDHNEHGRHNESIYKWLVANLIPAEPNGVGWVFVLMQYTAFQYTSAKLLDSGARLTRYHHDRRNDDGTVFKGHITLVGEYLGPDAEVAYEMLHQLGQDSRYRSIYKRFSSAEAAKVEIGLQDFHLQEIKRLCDV